MFEFLVNAGGMIRGDEAHLFREWEIEIDDTTLRAVAGPIIHKTIRANVPPGMRTIYFLKLLIHIGRYENGNCGNSATKRQKRAENITLDSPQLGTYGVGARNLMIYIQIPAKNNAIGFLTLAKSGTSVLCLPQYTYGVSPEHLTLLRQKRIPFKKV